MRLILIATALAFLVSTSAFATQLPNRGQCKRLTKQIDNHAMSVRRAEGRGNALWARATLQQIERLDQRRERLCPDLYGPSQSELAMEELKRLAKMAAKGAVSFFTMGAM